MEKMTKRIKNEVPIVLPDSAQGPSEGLNPILHILGLGLGPLPYWFSYCYVGLQELFTPENRTPQRTVPGY